MCGQLITTYLTFFNLFITVFAIESRVFGGEDLRFDVHKYLVKLKVHHQYNLPGRCSGSIIDHSWIVTSAHCLDEDAQTVIVYHYVEDSVRVIAKVDKKNFILHPEYVVHGDRRGDIALMKTTSPIKFNDYVQPVKLTTILPRIGQMAVITGYGDSESENFMPREGAVIITSCPNYLVNGLICTLNTARAGPGDSGGALISRGRLIGVTSASCRDVHIHKQCLTVYVDVVQNLKWIQEVVNSDEK